MDGHVAHVAHRIGPVQLDRLVEEAIARFMPEEVERRRRAASDGRRFDVETRDPSLAGTAQVWGELDLADALDLDAAVAAGRGAAEGARVHRLARRAPGGRGRRARPPPADPRPHPHPRRRGRDGTADPKPRRRARQVVLYAHLSDPAITDPRLGELGRLENTRSLITAEQVRTWCGSPDTVVVVRPVLDLNDHVHVTAYEVPDRMAEAAALADVTCVFPFCTRPARGCRPGEHDADRDHIAAHRSDGPTCSANVAPLCRRHHRLKTHGGWRYVPVERGSYLWTSPLGLRFLRDHDGTLDVTRDRPVRACAHPPDS